MAHPPPPSGRGLAISFGLILGLLVCALVLGVSLTPAIATGF